MRDRGGGACDHVVVSVAKTYASLTISIVSEECPFHPSLTSLLCPLTCFDLELEPPLYFPLFECSPRLLLAVPFRLWSVLPLARE
jgi:hypothetical protein